MKLPHTSSTSHIALLGGGFDPPHLGHQLLALSVLALEPIDSLWVMPCASHPFSKNLSPFSHRLAMCELAFSKLTDAHVLEIEEHLPKPNYTLNTVERILEKYPSLKISIVIGSDNLEDIEAWHGIQELQKKCSLLIFRRQGFEDVKPPKSLTNIHFHAGFVLPDVKSRDIRKSIQHQLSLLDHKVVEYITQHKLYQ